MTINDINIESKEGQLLMAALVLISTENRTKNTSEEILGELDDIYFKMKTDSIITEE